MKIATKPYFKELFTTLLLMSVFTSFCYAQMDTVVVNNQKIACSVKEVTPDAVKYTFPGEEVMNSVYKNTVQKIIFKSGRVQTFAEASSYKTVTGVMDYDKVTITSVEGEIKGLYKLSDVSAKAKGTTVYSSQERVKNRAYKKLKIQAAMFGANIVYLTNQRTEGNKYGTYFTAGSTAETNLTGLAYSNTVPDFEKFKALLGTRTDFMALTKYELGASDADVSIDAIEKTFKISGITNENGVIVIQANLKGEDDIHTFQLAGFTDKNFSIAYRRKGTAYNLVIN